MWDEMRTQRRTSLRAPLCLFIEVQVLQWPSWDICCCGLTDLLLVSAGCMTDPLLLVCMVPTAAG
jgi:hypothetical protein